MGILDEIKSVAKTIRQIDNIELYQKVLNLQSEIMELLEENSKLKRELGLLKDKFKIKESLKFEHDAYWIEEAGTAKDGPFCSNCWDTHQSLVNMISSFNPEFAHCPNCKTEIRKCW